MTFKRIPEAHLNAAKVSTANDFPPHDFHLQKAVSSTVKLWEVLS